MDPFLETLNPLDPALSAAYRILQGQFAAMPVSNAEGNLLGAMTIDAAIAQVTPAASEIQGVRIFS